MLAAAHNTVTLPGYTRADATVFLKLTEGVRFQANVESPLNSKHYVDVDSNCPAPHATC
jgi:catecholate siderophore receptor